MRPGSCHDDLRLWFRQRWKSETSGGAAGGAGCVGVSCRPVFLFRLADPETRMRVRESAVHGSMLRHVAFLIRSAAAGLVGLSLDVAAPTPSRCGFGGFGGPGLKFEATAAPGDA